MPGCSCWAVACCCSQPCDCCTSYQQAQPRLGLQPRHTSLVVVGLMCVPLWYCGLQSAYLSFALQSPPFTWFHLPWHLCCLLSRRIRAVGCHGLVVASRSELCMATGSFCRGGEAWCLAPGEDRHAACAMQGCELYATRRMD